jgi:hypothetical protein
MLLIARYALLSMLILFGVSAQAKNNIFGPPDSDGPVVVDIGFHLGNINFISEADETFHFEGVLSMRWKDSRLAFDPAVTGYDDLYYQGYFQFNEVFSGWWPQVFLVNEAGAFDQQGVVLRVDPATSGIWEDDHHKVKIPQWNPPKLSSSILEYRSSYLNDRDSRVNAFRVQIDVERNAA